MGHSESKFTPGPWAVKRTDTTFYVESAEGIRVVRTSWHDSIRKPYPLKSEAFANATMAAAAPDMFEALVKVVEWNGMRVDNDKLLPADKQCPEIAEAMAAIAKARGLGQLADATKESPLP